jgi:pimeloyl-ACP methyl ester carboxylesterase
VAVTASRERVRAGGFALSVALAGDPAARPVVLLHGFPASSSFWEREAALLATRFRVIAPDLLGFGESERPRDADLSSASQAEVVAALLDELAVERAALAGHGLGGAVAWRLALAGRAAALILLDVPCMGAGPGVLASAEGVPQALLAPWADEPEALRRAADALRPEDLGPAVPDVPTMVLWGEDDPFYPAALAEAISDASPEATVALLPGCGHWVSLDAPTTVGPLLYEWLRLRYAGEGHAHGTTPHGGAVA